MASLACCQPRLLTLQPLAPLASCTGAHILLLWHDIQSVGIPWHNKLHLSSPCMLKLRDRMPEAKVGSFNSIMLSPCEPMHSSNSGHCHSQGRYHSQRTRKRATLTHPFSSAAEIIMFDDVVVVYKFLGDLMFYVTGHADENEVLMFNVLHAFYESLALLLR
jgi:hypothetical protein